ncbi:Short-chain dehydrogenase/reductase phqE [Paramyrothecium foliicola]|nr:Short-chain dehydrogenase/reductase phqE [Paramyrothecium foliicola]
MPVGKFRGQEIRIIVVKRIIAMISIWIGLLGHEDFLGLLCGWTTSYNAKFSSKLHGSRILVVGGSAGVGYAVAEASLEQDAAMVIISGSNPTRVANSIARLKASYPSKAFWISGFASDLAQEDELEANIVALLNAATNNEARKLDHIAYTAGDPPIPKALGDIDLNYIKASFLVRSFAAMLLAKHASEYLVPGPSSSLTLTSGTALIRPAPNWPALSAVTSSVKGLVAALALDLRPTRINAVTLGVVNTETFQSFWADKTSEEKEKPTALTEAKTLTGAVGKPEDVAEAYIHCMRDHNITGASIDTNSCQLLL